jgi:hypothetical protein
LALELIFRLPANEQFGYAELRVTAPSIPDLRREVADLDEHLFTTIGNAYIKAVAFQAVGSTLGAQVVSNDQSWPTEEQVWEAQEDPQASYGTFQASTYQQATQPSYTAPQQAWQQPTNTAPPVSPPGQQAPVCAHGPAKYVAAGISKAGKPYNAFWACQAPQGQQKCKLPRP